MTDTLATALAIPTMTEARLARLVNVSQSTVHRWKHGMKIGGPASMWLAVIASVPQASWPKVLQDRWAPNLEPKATP